MKRLFSNLSVFAVVVSLMVVPGLAIAQGKAAFKYDDPIGVIKIKPGEPIHIACWMVVAGPDASLGTDTKSGVEIAIDDKGGKVLGHPDQTDAFRIRAVMRKVVRLLQPNLPPIPRSWQPSVPTAQVKPVPAHPSSGRPGLPRSLPSNTAPYLTDPKRGAEYRWLSPHGTQ